MDQAIEGVGEENIMVADLSLDKDPEGSVLGKLLGPSRALGAERVSCQVLGRRSSRPSERNGKLPDEARFPEVGTQYRYGYRRVTAILHGRVEGES